jgi:hypothetical protein
MERREWPHVMPRWIPRGVRAGFGIHKIIHDREQLDKQRLDLKPLLQSCPFQARIFLFGGCSRVYGPSFVTPHKRKCMYDSSPALFHSTGFYKFETG